MALTFWRHGISFLPSKAVPRSEPSDGQCRSVLAQGGQTTGPIHSKEAKRLARGLCSQR